MMESVTVKMDSEEFTVIRKYAEMIVLEMEFALKEFASVN